MGQRHAQHPASKADSFVALSCCLSIQEVRSNKPGTISVGSPLPSRPCLSVAALPAAAALQAWAAAAARMLRSPQTHGSLPQEVGVTRRCSWGPCWAQYIQLHHQSARSRSGCRWDRHAPWQRRCRGRLALRGLAPVTAPWAKGCSPGHRPPGANMLLCALASAAAGQARQLERWLEMGGNPSALDRQGGRGTLLHAAAQHDQVECIRVRRRAPAPAGPLAGRLRPAAGAGRVVAPALGCLRQPCAAPTSASCLATAWACSI